MYANYRPELLTVCAELKIPFHLVVQMEFKCSKINSECTSFIKVDVDVVSLNRLIRLPSIRICAYATYNIIM